MKRRLQEFRREKQWTQQELATKVGIALATVYRWEAGTADPSPLALEKLKQLGFKE